MPDLDLSPPGKSVCSEALLVCSELSNQKLQAALDWAGILGTLGASGGNGKTTKGGKGSRLQFKSHTRDGCSASLRQVHPSAAQRKVPEKGFETTQILPAFYVSALAAPRLQSLGSNSQPRSQGPTAASCAPGKNSSKD